MDRLSFSAQNEKVGLMPTYLILHKLARTSDPKVPPVRGLGGVNKISREICLRVARARVSFSAQNEKVGLMPTFLILHKLARTSDPEVCPYLINLARVVC